MQWVLSYPFWDVMSIEPHVLRCNEYWATHSEIQWVLSSMFWDAMSIELPILRCNEFWAPCSEIQRVLSPMFWDSMSIEPHVLRFNEYWAPCSVIHWVLGSQFWDLMSIVIYVMSVYSRNLTCFNSWQLYFSSKFIVSQCDKSLSAGFIPINTWQQRASLPFKPAQGHCLHVKIYLC